MAKGKQVSHDGTRKADLEIQRSAFLEARFLSAPHEGGCGAKDERRRGSVLRDQGSSLWPKAVLWSQRTKFLETRSSSSRPRVGQFLETEEQFFGTESQEAGVQFFEAKGQFLEAGGGFSPPEGRGRGCGYCSLTFRMALRMVPSPTMGAWASSGSRMVNWPGCRV